MKSLALILIASGFPLLLSSQKVQYPDFNQYFDDFYAIELSQDSTNCRLELQPKRDHLKSRIENRQVKLAYKDSSDYSDFYNTYIYELEYLLEFTHLHTDSILNQDQNCNIQKATKRLKRSFIKSGYAAVYYKYAYNYYQDKKLGQYGYKHGAIEVTIDSLSRVYAYCFSVLRLKPEPIFHWCTYKGPIEGPEQNFLIVYCEKMRIQTALGDLQRKIVQGMFKIAEELMIDHTDEASRIIIEEEYRELFNNTPEVKDAIIAYYKSDKNKVIKLLY